MSKNKNNKPIWGTRIKKNASTLFKKVGGSLPVDKRLFKEDIEGSIAHVEMLHKQKIINFRIKNKIIWGLKRIKNEIVKKKFNFDYDLEDIHMNIENRLFELIGDGAGIAKNLKLRGLPTTLFIDKDGYEFARIVGSIDFNSDEFLNWLDKLN